MPTSMTTADVKFVQQALVRLGWGPLADDGIYGPATRRKVVVFQQSSGLKADGIVGPVTSRALLDAVQGLPPAPVTPEPYYPPGPRGQLLRVAYGELGVQEDPNGSNGGPRVDVYTNKWRVPWCALFVSWAVRQVDIANKTSVLHTPIASVVGWRDWFADHAQLYPPYPVPGDAFLMLYHDGDGVDTGHGHIGLVLSSGSDIITTIEGNASNGVRSCIRRISDITAFGRIYA